MQKKSVIISLLSFACSLLIGLELKADQSRIDSLKDVLDRGKLDDLTKLSILDTILTYTSSPEEMLMFSDDILACSSESKYASYFLKGNLHKGIAYRLKGDFRRSLHHLFLCAKMAYDDNEFEIQIKSNQELSTTYTSSGQLNNALLYGNRAIELIRRKGDKKQLAINLLNTGYIYYLAAYLDSALLLFNEAEPLFASIRSEFGKAYTIGNRALVYWKQGDVLAAEKGLLNAIKMLQPLDDQFGMADYHNQIGRIYLEQGNRELAIYHTKEALKMAMDFGLKEQMRDASLLLSELYEQKKKYQQALDYKTQYVEYKDSIENKETTRKMAELQTSFEVSLKEKEIDLLENNQSLQKTYIAIAFILLLLSVSILLYFRQRFYAAKLLADGEKRDHDEKIKNILSAQETKTLQAMIEGRDQERKHLAQELHNHFGSLLATIKVNINSIDKEVITNHDTLITLIDQACTDVRNMSHALNMGISDGFGLVPSLKELTSFLNESGEIDVAFSASVGEGQLDSDSEILIYRIVQELLSNALKHAKATKLSVSVTFFEREKLVNVMVEDNGTGFDPTVEKRDGHGMGIKSLKKMVEDRNGEIQFDSHLDRGTTVTIDLPLVSDTELLI